MHSITLFLLYAFTTCEKSDYINELITLHYDEILSYINKKNKTNYSDEEIASDVFVQLYRYADRIDFIEKDKIIVYIYKMANNTITKKIKEKKQHGLDNTESIPLKRIIKANICHSEDDDDPETMLLRKEFDMMARDFVMELDERDKLLLFYKITLNMSVRETAIAMNMSKSTVARKFNFLIKELGKKYEEKLGGNANE